MADEGKKEGMARAYQNANPEWKRAAYEALFKAAKTQATLTADDVIARIPPGITTHEVRALGPVMLNGARMEWIEKADEQPVNCTRPNCHSAPITVWKSLMFNKDDD